MFTSLRVQGHQSPVRLFPYIKDLKIEVFRRFPRTAKVKKSRDQGLAVRFAV